MCAIAGIFATAPAFAVSDTSGPVVSQFDFTPKSVDVNSGEKQVTVSVRLTDDTGAQTPTMLLSSDSTTQTLGFGTMSRISGTAQDGIYQRTVSIPTTAAPGTWSVTLYPVSDTLGNNGAGFQDHPTKLTVTNTPPTPLDTTGPVVSQFDFTPKSVDVNSGEKQVTVSVRLTDDTGAQAPTAGLFSNSTSQILGVAPMTRVSGTAQDGVYELTVTVPTTAAPGTWSVTLYPVSDTLGNNGAGFQDHPTKLTVANGPSATAPEAPTGVMATAGNASATLSWSTPVDGGSPITGYEITSYPGAITKTVTGASTTSATLTGLANGTAYTFTVKATNAVGDSPASQPSNPVTPTDAAPTPTPTPTSTPAPSPAPIPTSTQPVPSPAPPSRMNAPMVAVTKTKAVIRWTTATSNGSAISAYVIDISKGKDRTTGGTARKVVIKGLKPGRYKVRIAAINAVGRSPYSNWVKIVIR